MIYVDDNGNAIQDIAAGDTESYTNLESVEHLSAVPEVLGGGQGYLFQDINAEESLIVFHPVVIGVKQWGVLLLQPTKDAFGGLEQFRNESYVVLIITAAILSVSCFFLISFRKNSLITKELHDANVELVVKDKLKDEFLKIASHELRTPIQPIIGYAALGARGLLSGNDGWKVVHKEAQRLMKLANNIVDISMVQSGVIEYNMEETHIAGLIRKAVESSRPIAEDKKLSLEINVDETVENIDLIVDATRLSGVFGELLDNAIKFTDKGGIRVDCITEEGRLLVRFSDTGSTIPTEQLPKLFDTFSSTSVNDATIQGAGLGLFICKAIITAHGGTIIARNNSEGPGVVFEITLPMSPSKLVPKAKAAIS